MLLWHWCDLMEVVIQDLKRYLRETLGIQVAPKLWKDLGELPLFLRDLYVFYAASLLGKTWILAVARSNEMTPASIQKHLKQVQAKIGMSCIYVNRVISPYNRKRLVKHGVQFVVPHRQIYLPALGVDWLDRCRECQADRAILSLAPSAQAAVIYALSHSIEKEFTPLELAKRLDYTPMTMTRVFNELEMAGLGKSARRGKERWFSFAENKSSLWAGAEPLLQNPVRRRLWLKVEKNCMKKIGSVGALSGLSALAELSMLSPPTHPVYAISAQEWKELQQLGGIQELPSAEEADIELEVWGYDPKLFAKRGVIDCFSLYLSLKENQDERVEMMLKEMMKGIKW